jgi:hypothetical protein
MFVFSNNLSKTVNVTDHGAGSIGEYIGCWWTWSTVVVHHATGLMNYTACHGTSAKEISHITSTPIGK